MADTTGQGDIRKSKATGSMAEKPQQDWKKKTTGSRFSKYFKKGK